MDLSGRVNLGGCVVCVSVCGIDWLVSGCVWANG